MQCSSKQVLAVFTLVCMKLKRVTTTGFPQDWSPMKKTDIYKRVPLDPSSNEYKTVENKFKSSSPAYGAIIQVCCDF